MASSSILEGMTERNGLEPAGTMIDHRPNVKPSIGLWTYCEDVAKKKGITPMEVFKEIVFVGEIISKIENSDGRLGSVVWKRPDGTEVELRGEIDKNKTS